MDQIRRSIAVWSFTSLLVLAACAPAGLRLTGTWTDAHDSVLEIRPDGTMTLITARFYGHAGDTFPVLLVPGPNGERQAVELRKCDPQSCFTDLETLEMFEHAGDWREIKPALEQHEFTYRVIDASHIGIEPAGQSAGAPALDISGTAAFEILESALTLKFEDGRVLHFHR